MTVIGVNNKPSTFRNSCRSITDIYFQRGSDIEAIQEEVVRLGREMVLKGICEKMGVEDISEVNLSSLFDSSMNRALWSSWNSIFSTSRSGADEFGNVNFRAWLPGLFSKTDYMRIAPFVGYIRKLYLGGEISIDEPEELDDSETDLAARYLIAERLAVIGTYGSYYHLSKMEHGWSDILIRGARFSLSFSLLSPEKRVIAYKKILNRTLLNEAAKQHIVSGIERFFSGLDGDGSYEAILSVFDRSVPNA